MAMKVYTSSYYGSNLWDFSSEKVGQVFTAWNTAVKLAWGCPQQTRTYFLQQVLSCGYNSAKVDILSRYVRFFHCLRSSACQEVTFLSRYVARDVQSTTGRNLCLIRELSGLNPWNCSVVALKQALVQEEVVQVAQQDVWRLPYLCSLLSQRGQAHSLGLEVRENYLSELISSLVIN